MSIRKCTICRSYYDDGRGHPCPGLRTVDWVRFLRSLRDWMANDNNARFEAYYARWREGRRGEQAA
ncbi:hypothetical protein C3Y87_01275 [Carbonactinospora thermoautotrophica]|uniref:Uncharacterized protein n=1 Tax=Carbonactinospora thermoautotrophica TaxID=1469144 RepID=A0A132N8A1_9ACTN|nr:hypothetical protein [Carbonactinospora thermoautotrophica]KWX02154.1 hypothetical protein LI90_3196 [Carbonactinospora thermoautotrophica]KWX03373.1 hypothetical protein TH66_10515 [Carbonactinospora thermoautotrophica]KWX06344.1 hypothetical protein TR74_22310 [Carbonactinospora thermoautotrophica]MCX9190063.1 hypothetical protein [Carbonactinospora thermoautotrophica]